MAEERRQAMIELHERVASLEVVTKETRDDVKDLVLCIKGNGNEEHSLMGRLGSLETTRTWVRGIAAALGAAGTTILALLGLRKWE